MFLKQLFSVFKQHFMHFHIFFHPHVFLQKFSNNNFQFLNTNTKRTLVFPNPIQRTRWIETKKKKKSKKGWNEIINLHWHLKWKLNIWNNTSLGNFLEIPWVDGTLQVWLYLCSFFFFFFFPLQRQDQCFLRCILLGLKT